jgi:hypothetical protein
MALSAVTRLRIPYAATNDPCNLVRCQSMRTLCVLALLLALCASSCQRKERESTGPLEVIHETLEAARPLTKVQIDITCEKQDPSPSELQLQQAIEKRIEQEHIGRVVDDGSGPSYVRINVEVNETATSIGKLRAILQAAGVLNHASVKIVQT